MKKLFKKDKKLFINVTLLAFLILSAFLAPLIAKVVSLDPEKIDLVDRFASPSLRHLLGSDDLGRDIFIRILFAGRISLFFAFILTFVSISFGTLLGILSGYLGGKVDYSIMRITDALSSLPILPIMIIFSAIDLNKIFGEESMGLNDQAVVKIFTIILFFSWINVTSLIRGEVMKIRTTEYITAVRSQGGSDFRIMFFHVLPNVFTPILSIMSVSLSSTILYESTLSFLGLGIKPPSPSLGNMLSNSIEFMHSSPWLALFPGLVIFFVVYSLNTIAEKIKRRIA